MSYKERVEDIAACIVYEKAAILEQTPSSYYFGDGLYVEIDAREWFPDVDWTQYDNGQRNLTPEGWIVAREMIAPLVEDEIDKAIAALEAEYKETKSKYLKDQLKKIYAWKEGGAEK